MPNSKFWFIFNPFPKVNEAKLIVPNVRHRWKGSIYKLVLPELAIYAVLYYAINIFYRLQLRPQKPPNDTMKLQFHALVCCPYYMFLPTSLFQLSILKMKIVNWVSWNQVKYCGQASAVIPLQFMLGFYVSMIVTRWWQEYMSVSLTVINSM